MKDIRREWRQEELDSRRRKQEERKEYEEKEKRRAEFKKREQEQLKRDEEQWQELLKIIADGLYNWFESMQCLMIWLNENSIKFNISSQILCISNWFHSYRILSESNRNIF